MKIIRYFFSSILAIYLFGCTSITPFQKSLIAYNSGNFNKSEAVLKGYVETKKAKKDPIYPLMLLTLADSQFRLGDYQSALKSYNAAVKSMTVELSATKTTTQILKSESRRLYRGKPHDLAFAHYYMGICYFQLEDYESARIEFSKARLEDQGEKAGQEDDIACVHFMEGLCYKRLNNLNDAYVSFKKVTELKPEFPYGWYELTLVSDLLGYNEDAENYWIKYTSIVPENQQLPRDENSPVIFVILDLGKGPYKSADVLVGQFASYQKGKYYENEFDISLSGTQYGPGFKLDDTYFQAKTEGGFGGDVARKLVGVAAKEAIKAFIPFGGLFVGKSEADIRVWYTLSGEIYMALLPAKEEESYVLTLDFYQNVKNKEKKPLESYEQNWYFIPTQKQSSAKPLYFVSIAHLHNLNVDHTTISK